MAKSPEARVRDPVIKYAKQQGIHCIRMHFGVGVNTGWPDDILLLQGGKPLFIEFKGPGKLPTAKQQKRIGELRSFGYRAHAVDDVVYGKQLIDDYLEIDR